MAQYIDSIQPMILAGGLGTRLRSVVSDRPKVIADINGEPFLKYLLEQLIKEDFKSVLILCGYLGNMIKSHFGHKYKSLDLFYSQEKKALGTGGAIKLAAKKTSKDNLLVLNGDTYQTSSRKNFLQMVPQGAEAIMTQRIEDTSRYGRIEVDKQNRITGLYEKQLCKGEGLINTGTYLINRKNIINYPKDKFSIETDYITNQIKNLKIFSVETKGIFVDIGIPEDFFAAENILKSSL